MELCERFSNRTTCKKTALAVALVVAIQQSRMEGAPMAMLALLHIYILQERTLTATASSHLQYVGLRMIVERIHCCLPSYRKRKILLKEKTYQRRSVRRTSHSHDQYPLGDSTAYKCSTEALTMRVTILSRPLCKFGHFITWH